MGRKCKSKFRCDDIRAGFCRQGHMKTNIQEKEKKKEFHSKEGEKTITRSTYTLLILRALNQVELKEIIY